MSQHVWLQGHPHMSGNVRARDFARLSRPHQSLTSSMAPIIASRSFASLFSPVGIALARVEKFRIISCSMNGPGFLRRALPDFARRAGGAAEEYLHRVPITTEDRALMALSCCCRDAAWFPTEVCSSAQASLRSLPDYAPSSSPRHRVASGPEAS